MPVFNYLALDTNGRTTKGRLKAVSEAALESRLLRAGQWLIEAGESRALSGPRTRSCSVPRRLLIEFFLQLNLQLKSGVPIFTALAFQVENTESASFHAIQEDLVAQVQAGRSFSEALTTHSRAFSPLVVNLVRAGEASGQLAETCLQIHDYYEWVDKFRNDLRQAFLYPSVVLVATTLFIVLIFTFVVPRFAALLTGFKVALPPVTVMVMGVSQILVKHGLMLAAATSATVIFWHIAPRIAPMLGLWRDGLKLKVPVFGELLRLMSIARFARNLSIVLRAGIPVLEALELCKGMAANRALESAMTTVQAAVREGRTVHSALAQHSMFSGLLTQMVSVGESTGTLPGALQNVADYYDGNLGRRVKKLLTVLEPLVILTLVGIVGTVAVAMLLPITKLMGAR